MQVLVPPPEWTSGGPRCRVRSKTVLFPGLGFRCCLAGLEVADFLAAAAGLAARDVATSVARGAESLVPIVKHYRQC